MGCFVFIGTFLLYHIIFSRFYPVDANNVLQAPGWYTPLGICISLGVISLGKTGGLVFAGAFFGTFLLYHTIFSRFFPVDANNVLQAPGWYIPLGIGISFGVVFLLAALSNKIQPEQSSAPDQADTPDQADLPSPSSEPEADPQCSWVESELRRIDGMDGFAFENWCADALWSIGFSDVNVTPRSGDQGVDILAQKDGIKYAIQCKCYSSNLGNTPIQEVAAGKSLYRCHVGVVITNRYFTPKATELAEATGTLLWDRDWIIEHLDSRESTTPNYDQLSFPDI